MRLDSEIAEYSDDMIGVPPARPMFIGRPLVEAIDELMESTDWFVAQEPTPMKKGGDGEDDFGYKEPVKKPNSKDDDKQLSLF